MGIFELPEGYREIKKVDLQKDKRLAILLNVGAIVNFLALFYLCIQLVPFAFELGADNITEYSFSWLGMVALIVLYAFAHEFVHGFFFKRYSGKKAFYGFTGLYAFAGSDAYFSRGPYIVIALAPIVIFGLLFLLLNCLLPVKYFWWVYLIQLFNLSGAAGDIYFTLLLCRLPADLMVKDSGTAMSIYSRTE